MAVFKITWEIEVSGETPKDAAIEALEIMQDPFSEALFFTIEEMGVPGKITRIDLLTGDTE